jgi:CheY-like chemotaxis protein
MDHSPVLTKDAAMVAAVRSKQVLVLDDDPTCRETVEIALVSVGLEVTTAANSVEALALARHTRFDLIISDYYLPDYPGTDFIRLLRGTDGYQNIPVILLTGRADELDKQRLCDDLFLLILPKGCSSDQLLVAVFKCLAALRCPA